MKDIIFAQVVDSKPKSQRLAGRASVQIMKPNNIPALNQP
jgi:hypothetical protein